MFQTGQKIGPYLLERTLGEGSFGVVWLAEERTGLIQRKVALKLPKDADADLEAIRREAEVWLRAGKHHNVVQVLHADIYEGQVAIATEYIEGGSLHDRLRQEPGKTMSVEEAVEMTRGILEGLKHLHSLPPKPLVHRDLKPGNVLLRGDTPLLTDFGLSRAFSSTAFTQAGGTPGYMPPESFDDRFSPQTDIWAAGVTLYRMLKGELPFPQRDLSALIGAILNKEPEPLPLSVPGPVASVIFRALMKDPDRRFASAEEMRSALEDALKGGASISAAPATRLAPIPPLPSADPLALFDITAKTTAVDLRPTVPPMPAVPEIPRYERPGIRYSEALTALPEPRRSRGLTARIDRLLRFLGRDTTRFCGALVASVPVWGVLVGLARLLEHAQVVEAVPGFLLTSGLMSVLFARLAWHHYYRLPEKPRKNAAIRYAVLGLFSAAIVPTIVVAFVTAISGAISGRSEKPSPDPAVREIEPPA